MPRDLKIMAVFVLTVGVLVGISWYSYRVGYKVARETASTVIIMSQPAKPAGTVSL